MITPTIFTIMIFKCKFIGETYLTYKLKVIFKKEVLQMESKLTMMFLIAFIALIEHLQAVDLVRLRTNITTINTSTRYEFTIVDDNLQSSTGSIRIRFPVSKFTIASVTCYDTSTPSLSYTCTVSSNVLTVQYISNTSNLLQVTVENITNPGSTAAVSLTYQFQATNTAFSSAAYSFLSQVFTTATLQSCSITMSPTTVNSQSQAIITIKVRNAVPNNGSIILNFPANWVSTVNTSNIAVISTVTQAYRAISGTQLKSSIILDVARATHEIGADNVLNSQLAANQTVSFGISGILSPPTTATSNSVTITTSNHDSTQFMDSSACFVSGLTAQTLTLTSSSSFTLGVSSTLSIFWTTQSALTNNDIIQLTLPASMEFASSSLAGVLLNYGGNFTIMAVSLTSSLQRTFTISGLSAFIPSSTSLNFNISSIRPLINSASRSVTITVRRSGFLISSGTLSLTVSPSTLQSFSLSQTTKVVLRNTSLTFNLTLNNPISSSGTIKIIFPSQFVNAFVPVCSSSSSNIASSLNNLISCSISSKQVTVSSIFLNQVAKGSNVNIIINNVINPQTIAQTNAFVISTFYDSTSPTVTVDQSDSLTYTPIVTVGVANVTAESQIVAASTSCTIQYKVSSALQTSSLLTVQIPMELTLESTAVFSIQIQSNASQNFVPAISNRILNFSSGIIATKVTAGQVVKIKITGIKNPLSLRPSSTSFKVYWFFGSYSLPQQSVTSGMTVSATVMNSFTNVFANYPTLQNSNPTLVTFNIESSVALASGNKILITLGTGSNQMSFSNNGNMACQVASNVIPCFANNLILTMTLNISISANTTHSFTVDSITLGRSFSQSPDFTIKSQTSDNFGISQSSIIPRTNIIPSYITSLAFTINETTSLLNAYQSFTLNMQLASTLDSTDYIMVSVPNTYRYGPASLLTTSICSNSNYTCILQSENKFKVTGNFNSISSVSITVLDNIYVSPNSFNYAVNQYFVVQSFTSSNAQIDSTRTSNTNTQAKFYTTCNAKCKTCSSNTSFCVTCYTVNDGEFPGSNFVDILKTSDNKCVSSCSNGYYNDSGICTTCVNPCATCTDAVTCGTCVTGTYLSRNNSTCGTTCADGTYASTSNNVCESCLPNCLTCQNTATKCLTCISPFLLVSANNSCVSTCPSATFGFTNTANGRGQCLSCDVSCYQCSVASTNCTTCQNGYIVSSTLPGLCTNLCPAGKVNNTANGGVCQCAPQCLFCSVVISNCTSCNTSSAFPLLASTGDSCVSSCIPGTYEDTANNRCVACSQSNCRQCTVSQCTLCTNSTFLHSGTCRTSCPEGTTSENSNCVACVSGCMRCPSNSQICTLCYPSYLNQGPLCVLTCSTGFVSFNASLCLSSCPTGYTNVSNICIQNQTPTTPNNTNTTNPTTPNDTTTNTTVQQGRFVPFPTTIGYVVILAVGFVSRAAFSETIVPASIVSMGSIFQIASWIVVLILDIVNTGALSIGSYVFLAAIGINYILNFISLYFFVKYIQNDADYEKQYKKNTCGANIFKTVSCIVCHKMLMILFSCLFGIGMFRGKVSILSVFTPIDTILYISLIPSILAIAGASYSCYTVQSLRLESPLFIQSIDCIIVTILNMIFTLWVTVRSEQSYGKAFGNDKFYQTQEQINAAQGKASDDIEQAFFQQSGINNSRVQGGVKSYYYKAGSQIKKRNGQDDPLDPRNSTNKHPLAQRIKIQERRQNRTQDRSSQALVFEKTGKKNNPDKAFQEIEVQQALGDQLVYIDGSKKQKLPVKTKVKPNQKQNTNRSKSKDSEGTPRTKKTKAKKRKAKGNNLQKQREAILIIDQESEQFKSKSPQQQEKIRKQNQQNKIKLQALDQELGHGKVSVSKQRFSKDQDFNDSAQDDLQQIRLSPKKGIKDKNNTSSDFSKNQRENSRQKNIKNQSKNNVKINDGGTEKLYDSQESQNEDLNQVQKQNAKNSSQKKIKEAKKVRKHNDDLYVLFNNSNNKDESEDRRGQHGQNGQQAYQEEQPRIPVFHRKRKGDQRYTQSDGLDVIEESEFEYQKRKKQTESHKSLKGKKIKGVKDRMKNQDALQVSNKGIRQMHSTQTLTKNFNQNDELNNLKASQKVPTAKLIDKDFCNDDVETLKSNQGDFFHTDVSPSRFNIQNQRFADLDESSEIPEKPQFNYQIDRQGADIIPDDQQLDDGIPRFPENYNQNRDDQPIQNRLNRNYNGQNIDYDSVYNKNMNDDRIKQLEKIYLPRLQVNNSKVPKKRGSHSNRKN